MIAHNGLKRHKKHLLNKPGYLSSTNLTLLPSLIPSSPRETKKWPISAATLAIASLALNPDNGRCWKTLCRYKGRRLDRHPFLSFSLLFLVSSFSLLVSSLSPSLSPSFSLLVSSLSRPFPCPCPRPCLVLFPFPCPCPFPSFSPSLSLVPLSFSLLFSPFPRPFPLSPCPFPSLSRPFPFPFPCPLVLFPPFPSFSRPFPLSGPPNPFPFRCLPRGIMEMNGF